MAVALQLRPLHLAIRVQFSVGSQEKLFLSVSSVSPALFPSIGVSFCAARQRGPTASCLHFPNEPGPQHPHPRRPAGCEHPAALCTQECPTVPLFYTESMDRAACVTWGPSWGSG